jgi:hypothetical protein
MQSFTTHKPVSPTTGSIAARMEHRFGRRYPCGSSVRISAGAASEAHGWLLNVSMSGAYIRTALDPPPFSLVSVTRIRDDDASIELLASVVRRDANGVGIEWCETPASSICHLLGCPRPCHR